MHFVNLKNMSAVKIGRRKEPRKSQVFNCIYFISGLCVLRINYCAAGVQINWISEFTFPPNLLALVSSSFPIDFTIKSCTRDARSTKRIVCGTSISKQIYQSEKKYTNRKTRLAHKSLLNY